MILTNEPFLWIGVVLTGLTVLGFLRHSRRRRRLAEFLGGPRAAWRVSRTALGRPRWGRLGVVAVASLALALASADLRLTDRPPPPEPPPAEIVLAIDVSASMQASDLAPTRLARARELAEGIVGASSDVEVGLVLFAGTSYPIAPPTRDHDALRFFLDGLAPTIASAMDPGTHISAGIAAAADWLPEPESEDEGGRASRSIIVLTDGESEEPDPELDGVLETMRAEGITVYALGVGTEEGATMTMPAGRYQLGGPVLDAAGAPVRSVLRAESLQDLARLGGGNYVNGSASGAVRDVASAIQRRRTESESEEPPIPVWSGLDIPLLLGFAALALIVAESLLDLPVLRRSSRIQAREGTRLEKGVRSP